MPTVNTGVQASDDVLAARHVVDMSDGIAMLEDDVAPFTKFMSGMKKKPAKATQVYWLEDELRPRRSTCNGGATNVATTVNVATGEGQYFRAGDVVRCERSGENLYVTAVVTDALTVTRSIGAVAAASIAASEGLIIIGNASAQGVGLGTIKVTAQSSNSNYTTIQRDPWGFTSSELAVDLYGAPEPGWEKGKKYVEHMRAIEYGAFFGQRDYNTSGTTPIGYAGGLIDYLSTNTTNVAGSLSRSALEGYLQTAFRYGSKNKIMFCAPIYGRAVSQWASGNVQIQEQGTDKTYGIEVTKYVTYLGYTLSVYVKRDWTDFSTANTETGSYAFIVDPAMVEFNPLRDTRLLNKRQANDEDSDKSEYLTEWTMRVKQERCHMILKGVTGIS